MKNKYNLDDDEMMMVIMIVGKGGRGGRNNLFEKNLFNFHFIWGIWKSAWGYYAGSNIKNNYEQLYRDFLYHAIKQFLVYNSKTFSISTDLHNNHQNKF